MTKAKSKVAEANTGLAFLAGGNTDHVDLESNAGNEAVRQEDKQVPRLKMSQLISDEIKNGDPSYIEGLNAGDFFDSATRQAFGGKIYVLNVFYKMMYNVWRDRKNNSGGLVGSFETAFEAQTALNEACVADRIPLDDRDLIDKNFQNKPTGVHYLLVIDPETSELTPVIFDMDSSKLGVSKKWNSTIAALKGARFSHVWELTTYLDSNKQGDQYYNLKYADMGFVNKELMAEATEALENIVDENKQFLLNRNAPVAALEEKEIN